MTTRDLRARLLSSCGATAAEVDELLACNHNVGDPSMTRPSLDGPLSDEPFVAAWAGYAAEAHERGVAEVLRERLVQLRFPVRVGISASAPYRAATRRGVPTDGLAEATGLALHRPEE